MGGRKEDVENQDNQGRIESAMDEEDEERVR